jgi:hypothetical protein
MVAVARDGAVFVKVNQRPVMPTATIYKHWAAMVTLGSQSIAAIAIQ